MSVSGEIKKQGTKSDLRKLLLDVENSDPADIKDRVAYPVGWAPGVQWDSTTGKGQVTSGQLFEPPTDWTPLLVARGLDPDVYEIDGETVKWCSWDGWFRGPEGGTAVSKICYSFRADIRLKRNLPDTPDVNELLKEVSKAKRGKKAAPSGEYTLVVPLSDWQIGNGDSSIERQVEAVGTLPEKLTDRLSDLRKLKYDVGQILVVGMGDLGEGVCGFYPYQLNSVTLDRREQTRLTRRGLTNICTTLAPQAEKFILSGVGGNHGENRGVNGKRVTGANDNDDVAVLEQVAEILMANPEAYGNVSVRLPTDRLLISLNISGKILAFTHGHLPKPKGAGAIAAVWDWWRDQMHGTHFPSLRDADILTSGHFHHFNVKQDGRTLFICPSLVTVGSYWGDLTGSESIPGTLTYLVGPDGWGAVEIIK